MRTALRSSTPRSRLAGIPDPCTPPDETQTRHSQLRSTAAGSAEFELGHTCYRAEADLQAVAPLPGTMARKFYVSSRRIRREFRLCQRHTLVGHGFHRRSPIGGPQLLATMQGQTRCTIDLWLALAIELQCQGLPQAQDRRGPLARLLRERPVICTSANALLRRRRRARRWTPDRPTKEKSSSNSHPRGSAGRRLTLTAKRAQHVGVRRPEHCG